MTRLRLNKALAAAGVCSRRKADELIQAGLVRVNGDVVTELGLRIDPATDAVSVEGKAVPLPQPGQEGFTYIVLHKPTQVVTTVHDPEGRPTVLSLLPAPLREKRLYPVGRLDYFSEGLLLITDDGELTHRLTHPRYHVPKHYEVRVRETPTKGMLLAMRGGMTLEDGTVLAPVEVTLAPESNTTLLLTLHQGINRQIRRMCRDLGLTILTLRRVALGPIALGTLPKGECRPLSRQEITWLKRAVELEK